MENYVELQTNPLEKLKKDIKNSVLLLSREQVRYLVDSYYTVQDWRKAACAQARELDDQEKPSELIEWLASNAEFLEGEIKKALGAYSAGSPVGRWAESIVGIGPVISAGLLAHVDIERAPHAGHIWNFAGLNPTRKWTKGEKRPWNASLKTLCWKIGQSFLKQSGRDGDFYGHLLMRRLDWERRQNVKGAFQEQAAAKLATFKIGHSTSAYAWYSGAYVGEIAAAYLNAGIPFAKGETSTMPTGEQVIRWQRVELDERLIYRFAPFMRQAGYDGPESFPEDGRVRMLPPSHILARACRWTVKLFLCHWHHVAYEVRYGKPPSAPWILDPKFGGHTDIIRPPNWPVA